VPRNLLTPEQKQANKREANRRWAAANQEKVEASRRKYDAANKAKIAASKAAARKADPAKFAARTAEWRAANPEKERAYSARRYEENKEAVRAQLAEWRARNPDRLKVVLAASRKKPQRAERRREYARTRHATDPQVRLANLLRNRIRKALKGVSAASALAALGCSVAALRAHLEAGFLEGMTWENHGEWHIDHRRPLASFDLGCPQQYAAACHYTNLQPLWGRENQSKGARYEQRADAQPDEHPVD
jgi:hypothetical protein